MKILDKDGVKVLWRELSLKDYPNNETLMAVIDAIDETKADKNEIPLKVSQLENDSNFTSEEQVNILFEKLNSNTALKFYCIEDVTIILNGISTIYPANSNVEIKLLDTDIFEIVPTSDNSILSLNAFPGALGTYYSWLEGVKQFSNILFDMNSEDMYSKWSQGNQGSYQVQYAQYLNCIFWSDNPYISDVAKRTNYTLYNSSQLPLCYSSIPDNTFKAFYLALGVNSDPNWSNPAYKESFAKATWATQVFSYYGARVIGTPEHFSITLPKDCRGLMFYARNTEAAGTFDATNVTNFGAKSGSWREAFGYCSSLKRLYITNLKVNLNISWSPIDYDSIYYIISKATNTSAITISVSPYTYNLLSESDFELAASKNITIALLATNYIEDKRLSNIANKAEKSDLENLTGLVDTNTANITTLQNELFNLIYPIGAIYLSTTEVSPSTLFGGTWEQIKDTFLLAAGDTYIANSTGGEAEHVLTIDETPEHNHKLKTDIESPNYNVTWPNYWEYNEGWVQGPNSETEAPPTNTTSVGGNQPHNNMPPYLAVYMWKRIS